MGKGNAVNISNLRAMNNRQRQSPEKAEQAAIVQLLESLGAKVYVLGTRRRKGDYQGTMQTPGIPDLYVFLPHVRHPQWPHAPFGATALWIEVKAEGGKLSPEQETFQCLCRNREVGHVVGGLHEVMVFLATGGWIKATA